MRVITHKLPDFTELEILALADLHLGDIHADGKLIIERLDYIRKTENAYTILNGDLMDAAIKTSIGDVYGASLQPMEQLKHCVQLFEPIKDKILAVLPGNHEARIYRGDGVDMTEVMCDQLQIGDRYARDGALVFVRFGKHKSAERSHARPICYAIYASHGAGSGRTPGAKINRLVDMAAIVDADIYIMSHVHQPAVLKTAFYRVSQQNSSVRKVDKLFVNTAAALDYGGYGESALYRPASKDTPIIKLSGREKKATAEL